MIKSITLWLPRLVYVITVNIFVLLKRASRRFPKYIYAIITILGTKKKVDAINEENIRRAKEKGKEVTILLHGTLANYYKTMYCTIIILKKLGLDVVSIGYNYNTPIEDSGAEIKKKIEKILKETNKKKVNIFGICLGGVVARYYAEVLGGKEKINRLVTLQSPIWKIPEKDTGAVANSLFGGRPRLYNSGIEKIKNKHTVKDYLYICSLDDLIIKPEYSIHTGLNCHILRGGHLFASYYTEALRTAAVFIKTGKVKRWY